MNEKGMKMLEVSIWICLVALAGFTAAMISTT